MTRATIDVPAELREQYARIAARATSAGRPLHAVPELEIRARGRHGSKTTGLRGTPRVQLSADLLAIAPSERAWTIAHELSHVLRAQQGKHPVFSRATRLSAGASAAWTLVTTVAALYLAFAGPSKYPGVLLALSSLGLCTLWTVLAAPMRREEIAADETAAVVFGEVLTEAGVHRLTRLEGFNRFIPGFLRDHPHPSARRNAGLVSVTAPGEQEQ